MKPWQLGNTTVRSGLRTRDALIALRNSGAEGRIRQQEGDRRFRQILGQAGVVRLGSDPSESVGRKFRSAMTQLGFLYPEKPIGSTKVRIGPADHITPAGHRFIEAQSVIAQQECFLRAISGISFSTATSTYSAVGDFSPLLHVLRLLRTLQDETGDSSISFVEFAIFVQTTNNMFLVNETIEQIIIHREARKNAANKKSFDSAAIEMQCTADQRRVKPSTYRDYADMNIRYLLATGLFSRRGRGLSFYERQKTLIDQLIHYIVPTTNAIEYWTNLTNGPSLPLDNLDDAKTYLGLSLATAESKNINIDASAFNLNTPADIAVARYEIENLIAVRDEHDFARAQFSQWQEIAAYLAIVQNKKSQSTDGDNESVVIPPGEKSAYLEWSVWRAFLAINRLLNPPNESRRFKIDRDFLPTNHAAPNGPDLIFEFESFTLVVEVTLLTNSRQESHEGESVRRHTYKVITSHPSRDTKPIYCLFIAPAIDVNTFATFLRGEWHEGDSQFDLPIIPVTIEQFIHLFTGMFEHSQVDNRHIQELISISLIERESSKSPTEWQRAIGRNIQKITSTFKN
jgi:hypothetical protein